MLLRLLLALLLVPASTHASSLEELSVARALLRHVQRYPTFPEPKG